MPIIWIASYPKSGNTLVRFLLQNYFYQHPKSAAEIEQNIPWVKDLPLEKAASDDIIFSKTHYLFDRNHPYYEYTLGAIVIIRNPRDVLLSNIHYARLTTDHYEKMEQELAINFILNHGMSWWINLGFGSWPQHVRSWRLAPISKCILTYESLVQDTEQKFRTILDYLEVEIEEDRLQSALHHSTLESIRALEEEDQRSQRIHLRVFPVRKSAYQKGLRFANQGKNNQSLEPIYPGLDRIFDQAFASAMIETGYCQYGLTQRSITTPEGVNLVYWATSANYPYTVVMLHATLDHGSNWSPLSNLFAGQANVLVPDLRGHGKSDSPDQGYSLDHFAYDILHILNIELNPTKIVLVGESLGALVAARIAHLQADRVKALLLSEPPLNPSKLPWLKEMIAAQANTQTKFASLAYEVFGYNLTGGHDRVLEYYEMIANLRIPTLLARGGVQVQKRVGESLITPSGITPQDLQQLRTLSHILLTKVPQAGHHLLRKHFLQLFSLFAERVLPLGLFL